METTETVNCLICGADDGRPILRRPEPRHVICRQCGFVYQSPRPTEAAMASRYESGYWENHPSYHARLADIGRQRGGIICDWIGHLAGREELVLDVGCGPGVILNHLRETLNCRVLGIEPSADQAASAQKRYGLEVIPGDIHTAELGDRKPKVIVLSHVVEHLYDPVSALRRCE